MWGKLHKGIFMGKEIKGTNHVDALKRDKETGDYKVFSRTALSAVSLIDLKLRLREKIG